MLIECITAGLFLAYLAAMVALFDTETLAAQSHRL